MSATGQPRGILPDGQATVLSERVYSLPPSLTGYDVVMGALLGADEFGFGTIAMIAEGCIMARICHTNSCPVGVTTQREALRKKFVGTPDNVLDFFQFVAQAMMNHQSTTSLIRA